MSAVSCGSQQGSAEVREPEAPQEPGQLHQLANAPLHQSANAPLHQPADAPRQAATADPVASQADFGANEWLVEELYQRYLADPGSVDRARAGFFADYQPPLPNAAGAQPDIPA